jgi:hypothetical protein
MSFVLKQCQIHGDDGMNEDILPKDFTTAVKDIKLAILQARAHAAQLSNV